MRIKITLICVRFLQRFQLRELLFPETLYYINTLLQSAFSAILPTGIERMIRLFLAKNKPFIHSSLNLETKNDKN